MESGTPEPTEEPVYEPEPEQPPAPAPEPVPEPTPAPKPEPTPTPTPTSTATSTPSPAPTPTSTPGNVTVSIHYGVLESTTNPVELVESQTLATNGFSLPQPTQYLPGRDYIFDTDFYHCQSYVMRQADGSYLPVSSWPIRETALSGLPVQGDNYTLNLYIVWSRNRSVVDNYFSLPLRFDANGGSLAYTEYDAMTPLASRGTVYPAGFPEPTSPGKTFTGWYAESSCVTPVHSIYAAEFFPTITDENGTHPDWAHSHFITLYAGWEPVSTP